MTKRATTLYLEDELIKRCKQIGLNISAFISQKLQEKLTVQLEEIPKTSLAFKCTKCRKVIDYGFFCRERKMFLCQECQDSFDMSRCIHDKKGEHFHIRVPGFEDKNKEYLKEVEDVIKEAFPSGG